MQYNNPSIAIGGLGGSGTRAVAQLFKELGFFMGYDLNNPNDNLLYTLLFKRKDVFLLTEGEFISRVKLFYKILASDESLLTQELLFLKNLAYNDNPQHSKEWLLQRVENLHTAPRQKQRLWGWKEPNTHLLIDKFLKISPNLKFIYVYRNGLDMAYSSNQNQLKFFGDIFLNEESVEITPRNALKYWCKAYKRMQKLQQLYPTNIYLLDFDYLCRESESSIKDIFLFMGISDKIISKELIDIFQLPSSYERHKKYIIDNFDREDIECIKKNYN